MSNYELNKKKSELAITIVAKPDSWKKSQNEALVKLAKNLSLKGFRKGKIPLNIAKKHINQSKIISEAVQKQLNILIKEADQKIEKDIIVLTSPTYKINKLSDVELEIIFIYSIYPEIKLASYKNIGIKYKKNLWNEKILMSEITKLQNSLSNFANIKTESQKDDVIIIDYDGFLNNKKFEGGSAKNYNLKIGSNQFLEDFENNMIGLKEKDKIDFEITFPKDYFEKKLQNQKVKFVVKVKEVKRKQELNENFAKSLKINNVNNMEELKKYLKDFLIYQHETQNKQKFQKEIFKIIKNKTVWNLPQTMIQLQIQNEKQKLINEIKKQNMTLEKYLEINKIQEKDIDSNYKEIIEDKMRDSFIFTEIAKLENINIKEEEYEKQYDKLFKLNNSSNKDALKKQINKEQMEIYMIHDKVIDILIKFNT